MLLRILYQDLVYKHVFMFIFVYGGVTSPLVCLCVLGFVGGVCFYPGRRPDWFLQSDWCHALIDPLTPGRV